MTIAQAIHAELIAAIIAKCGVTPARAAVELKAAKATAKATGLTLAETLGHLGLV